MKILRPFLILSFVALPMMVFAGQGIISALEAEGAPNENLSKIQKIAEQGNAVAQYNLGVMYLNGHGVFQNYAEAAKWFRKAAEQGIASAQFNLGVMYDKSEGVPQNYAEAAKWYHMAAEQGHEKAQYNLGAMYRSGQGVSQNYAEAAKWFRKAAEQGHAEAPFGLGVMYENGEGVPQNYKTACIWYSIASANMSGELQKYAADARDRVAKRLSPAALEQAQDIAREWRPKK